VIEQYPSWRYHATEQAVIVTSPEDESRRAPTSEGWADSPDRVGVVAPRPIAGEVVHVSSQWIAAAPSVVADAPMVMTTTNAPKSASVRPTPMPAAELAAAVFAAERERAEQVLSPKRKLGPYKRRDTGV
jgi:hypothetical protein